ncbi:MAG: aldo/keto reductase [Proteobacteria bacterium]|nr:aldo/keto reductase [Pseudomonadota bacterium]MBW3617815.1 aldo/keto reductase [Pseudomonadota bacterium]
MRYRPLSGQGAVVSAVSLRLRADTLTHAEAVAAIHGAVEQGVNFFDLAGDDVRLLEAVGEALGGVDRDLLVLAVRIGGDRNFDARVLQGRIVDALRRLRVGYVNAVILDQPSGEELSTQTLSMLKAARASGKVRMLGLAGTDESLDLLIATGAFDLLMLPFNLTSGQCERRRLMEASKRDMAVVGYDPWPQMFRAKPATSQAKPGLLARVFQSRPADPLSGVGTYAFLDQTPGWTSEEICLAYALTDVKLASVQVEVTDVDHLARLAAIADRELPPASAAQVEMARFAEAGAAA